MPKRKGHFQEEAHFIAELPLDVCVQRLRDLNDAALQIAITRQTPDEATFTVQMLEDAIVIAAGSGTLRRWQGTHTRVDCEMHIREGVWRWLLSMGGLLLIFGVILPLFILAALPIGGWLMTIIWLVAAVGFSLLGWAVLAQVAMPIDDVPPSALRLIERVLTQKRKHAASAFNSSDSHTERHDVQATGLSDGDTAYNALSR